MSNSYAYEAAHISQIRDSLGELSSMKIEGRECPGHILWIANELNEALEELQHSKGVQLEPSSNISNERPAISVPRKSSFSRQVMHHGR